MQVRTYLCTYTHLFHVVAASNSGSCFASGLPCASGYMARQANAKWRWSAGGLDSECKLNSELQFQDAPPLGPPRHARTMLQRLGYSVRHKLSSTDLQKMGHGLQPRLRSGLQPVLAHGLQPGKRKRLKKSARTKWCCLNGGELTKLYHRHRDMIIAANSQLARDRAAEAQFGPLPLDADEIGFFGHDESGASRLSDNSEMGLASACSLGGLKCIVYCYRIPDNLPQGVRCLDANEVLTLDDYHRYRERGVKEASVADLARLRGMQLHLNAGAVFVWFCDLDTHWVSDAKAACSQLPATAFHHMVATLEGATGRGSCVLADIKRGMSQFLQSPRDRWKTATPFRVTKRTTLVQDLQQSLEFALQAAQQGVAVDYLVMMKELGRLVSEAGLLGAYQKPHCFAPVPYYSKAKCCKEQMVSTAVTAQTILEKSVACNSYWPSGKNSTETLCDRGAHTRVRPGSLWDELLRSMRVMISAKGGLQPAGTTSMRNQRGLQPRRRLRGKTPDPCADVLHPLPWADVEPHPGQAVFDFRWQMTERPMSTDRGRCYIKLRLQLVRRLGQGTSGICFAGKYRGEAREVAVKVSTANRVHKAIAPTEVALMSRAQRHPNVIRLLGFSLLHISL